MKANLILKSLTSRLHDSKNRHITHEKLSREFQDLCSDMDFIHQAIKDCIINPNFFKNANILFFRLSISGDVYIDINLFPPILDRALDITHDNIHHHGWRLLTTGVISGDGYETITFLKKSHENKTNNNIHLKIEEIYTHTKSKIRFIDSYQTHVVFHPQKTTATLALWSSEKPLLNQQIKRYMKYIPAVGNVLTKVAHISKLNNFLGLNAIKGLYFHPENGKIIETQNYSKNIDGTREQVIHCMFNFFQQIKLNDIAFFSKIKKTARPEVKILCDKLMSGEIIPDYGIQGNIRRHFSKKEILESLDKK